MCHDCRLGPLAGFSRQSLHPPLTCGFLPERAKGIEPSFSAWEADVLPLNYARGMLYFPLNLQFRSYFGFAGPRLLRARDLGVTLA